jgi:hypothetical protein
LIDYTMQICPLNFENVQEYLSLLTLSPWRIFISFSISFVKDEMNFYLNNKKKTRHGNRYLFQHSSQWRRAIGKLLNAKKPWYTRVFEDLNDVILIQ